MQLTIILFAFLTAGCSHHPIKLPTWCQLEGLYEIQQWNKLFLRLSSRSWGCWEARGCTVTDLQIHISWQLGKSRSEWQDRHINLLCQVRRTSSFQRDCDRHHSICFPTESPCSAPLLVNPALYVYNFQTEIFKPIMWKWRLHLVFVYNKRNAAIFAFFPFSCKENMQKSQKKLVSCCMLLVYMQADLLATSGKFCQK